MSGAGATVALLGQSQMTRGAAQPRVRRNVGGGGRDSDVAVVAAGWGSKTTTVDVDVDGWRAPEYSELTAIPRPRDKRRGDDSGAADAERVQTEPQRWGQLQMCQIMPDRGGGAQKVRARRCSGPSGARPATAGPPVARHGPQLNRATFNAAEPCRTRRRFRGGAPKGACTPVPRPKRHAPSDRGPPRRVPRAPIK